VQHLREITLFSNSSISPGAKATLAISFALPHRVQVFLFERGKGILIVFVAWLYTSSARRSIVATRPRQNACHESLQLRRARLAIQHHVETPSFFGVSVRGAPVAHVARLTVGCLLASASRIRSRLWF